VKVAQTVAELNDPESIPALADSLGTGFVLHRTLAAFGEAAAPAVVAVVTSPESTYDAVNEGLIALRFMVEDMATHPLSRATLESIRLAAEQHLISPGRPAGTGTTLRWAIDLAVALNDRKLRGIVALLASNPNEVMARGITDP